MGILRVHRDGRHGNLPAAAVVNPADMLNVAQGLYHFRSDRQQLAPRLLKALATTLAHRHCHLLAAAAFISRTTQHQSSDVPWSYSLEFEA